MQQPKRRNRRSLMIGAGLAIAALVVWLILNLIGVISAAS